MKPLVACLALAALAGCAADPRNIAPGMSERDVDAAFGKPVAAGRLAGGEQYGAVDYRGCGVFS